MNRSKFTLCIATALSILSSPVFASHLIGDEFTYIFLDSTGGHYHYRVTLNLYADCLAGQPEAIAQDDPAYFGVYTGSGSLVQADSAHFSASVSLPVMMSGICGLAAAPELCVLKKTFVKDFYLPGSATGYTIVYQRCCKNAALTNIVDAGDAGSTYICTIPATGVTTHNNSAVFTNYPPLALAVNTAFTFDNSATDADGDSLSYELCNAYNGVSASNIKPYPPAPPPYTEVSYTGGLTYSNPMSCSVPLSIDPVTGVLSGTPNLIGRYLIAICCHEWRAGVLVNTVEREFEFSVVAASGIAYQPFAGNDTSIYVGDSIQFAASGAVSYHWTPATYLTCDSIYNPVGHFPDPGIFTYILYGVSDSGCTGYDTISVNVLEYSEMMMPNAFTPNGDGHNDFFAPISVKKTSLSSFKVFDSQYRLLYSSADAYPGWDGTYHGVKQEMGNYFWELQYTDNAGHTRKSSGVVTLLR